MDDLTKYKVLIQQYKNKIYTYSILILKNRMDADEVTQETFIKIWKNLDSIELSTAKSWIMRITHNHCMDLLRIKSRSCEKEVIMDEVFEDTFIVESDLSPQQKLELDFVNSRIQDAIHNLPDILKSIFVLYEIDNYKYSEISSILNLPINSVKVYLMRARKRLQDDLLRLYKEGVTTK